MKKLLFGLFILSSFSISSFAQTISQDQSDEVLSTVMKENKCETSSERTLVTVALPGLEVHKDAEHYGVTVDGDIAIISNDNGKAVLQILMCERPGLTGSGGITGKFILNSSPECLVSEITAGTLTLGSNLGRYILPFAPIDIPGTERTSSLCQREEKKSSLDESRITEEASTIIETLDRSEMRVIKE